MRRKSDCQLKPVRGGCQLPSKVPVATMFLSVMGWLGGVHATSQTCTTQSQMQAAERSALAQAAATLAQQVKANDRVAVQAQTIPEYANNFSPVAEVLSATSPHLAGAKIEVEQIYILDASSLKAAGDAQFFCTLNRSMAEADFSIPQLPVGRYAFVMVRMQAESPWRLSFLLRQQQPPHTASDQAASRWLLAGIYPQPLAASGHDGLWYWTEARRLGQAKQTWAAWLYFQEAQSLLQPAVFVSSTHLEKLNSELAAAAPPVVKDLTADAPLVIKGADGQEYRFSSITVNDSLGKEKIDVAAHLKVESLGDGAAARQRNLAAMAALVAAHPELRTCFHGVLIFAEAAGQSAYTTEADMRDIH